MAGVPLTEVESLRALASELGGELDRDAQARHVARVVAPVDAERDDDLVLVVSRRVLARARSAPGAFLTSPELAAELPAGRRWVHAHAMWVLTRLLRPAVTREEPQIGAGTRVGAGARILPGAILGEDCVIEPGAVIYGNCRLGARIVIGANAVIGRPGFGFTPAPDGTLARVPQLGGVVIEDDAEIGALSSVDAGTLGPTRIGRGAKLDAHVHVGHNVEIGAGSIVAAHAGFAGSSRIGRRVMIGGQAGVADHVSIGDDVRIAAKSGVIGDVAAGQVVAGFPAVPRVKWLRAMARLLARR